MNHVRITITVFLMILLAALSGCNSKKEKTAPAPPQKVEQAQQPQKAGTVVAPPQDEADAAAAKARVLAQVKGSDYSAIYKEASAGFKEVGPQDQFIAQWNKQLQETGAFKEAKETSHSVRPTDGFLVFIYAVQYEKKKKELRLTFGRSKAGKMELTGINQRDIK